MIRRARRSEDATKRRSDEEDTAILTEMLRRHQAHTGSTVAAEILGQGDSAFSHFIKVMPTDYKRVLEQRKREQLAAAS